VCIGLAAIVEIMLLWWLSATRPTKRNWTNACSHSHPAAAADNNKQQLQVPAAMLLEVKLVDPTVELSCCCDALDKRTAHITSGCCCCCCLRQSCQPCVYVYARAPKAEPLRRRRYCRTYV
jgi:hypothetical protein